MKLPAILRQVEAYWEGLRPYGDIPQRADINPRGLEDALDFAFLLEISQTGEPVFRLCGERLGDLLGIPLERVPLTALFSKECQTLVRNALLNVFSAPGVLRAEIGSASGMMRPELTADLLILPLRHDDGSISRALGVLYFDGAIGKTPRQFTRFSHNITRVVLSGAAPDPMPKSEPAGMAESGTTFHHQKGRPKHPERPELKLIDGGLK